MGAIISFWSKLTNLKKPLLHQFSHGNLATLIREPRPRTAPPGKAVGRQPRPNRQNDQSGYFAQNVIFEQSEIFVAKRSLCLRPGRGRHFELGLLYRQTFPKCQKCTFRHFGQIWLRTARIVILVPIGLRGFFLRGAFAILGGPVLGWAPE